MVILPVFRCPPACHLQLTGFIKFQLFYYVCAGYAGLVVVHAVSIWVGFGCCAVSGCRARHVGWVLAFIHLTLPSVFHPPTPSHPPNSTASHTPPGHHHA